MYEKNKTNQTKKTKNTHLQSRAENSFFQFCLTITKPSPSICLKETTKYQSLVILRTVSQLTMRVRKPKVEYKIVQLNRKNATEAS